jgi:hypothetical protein
MTSLLNPLYSSTANQRLAQGWKAVASQAVLKRGIPHLAGKPAFFENLLSQCEISRLLSSTLRILAKVERCKFNGLQNIDTNGSAFLPGRTCRKRFQTAENMVSIMAEVEK